MLYFLINPILKSKLEIGGQVTVTGKWDRHRQTITGSECHIGPNQLEKEFEPVYSVRGNISVKNMRRLIGNAFTQYGELIEENLPPQLLTRYKLMPRKEALKAMHFPASANRVKQARRRMVYEEFLLFQLKMQALRKIQREQSKGIGQTFDEEKVNDFIQYLTFSINESAATSCRRNINRYEVAVSNESFASRGCWIRENGCRCDWFVCDRNSGFSRSLNGSNGNFS